MGRFLVQRFCMLPAKRFFYFKKYVDKEGKLISVFKLSTSYIGYDFTRKSQADAS